MADTFLNKTGLARVIEKLKAYTDNKVSSYASKSIKSITRSGTMFTATALDGTTFTFTQQDNDTTYSAATASSAGLMSAADKSKLDGIESGATRNLSITTSMTISSKSWENGEVSFESHYPAADYDMETSLNGDTITQAQIDEWSKAQVVGSASANKLIAKGNVPMLDIPIILKIRSK